MSTGTAKTPKAVEGRSPASAVSEADAPTPSGQNISDVLIEALVAKALCQSGKFETGQGTCAAICMEVLGSARSGPHGCPHSARVHGKLAASITDALRQAKGGSDAS
jgi:hypothetical protein